MTTLPLWRVKDTLSALVEQLEATHERVTITKNGRPAAVLVAVKDLDALEETVAVLSDRDTVSRLRAAREELARGEGLDEAALGARVASDRARAERYNDPRATPAAGSTVAGDDSRRGR